MKIMSSELSALLTAEDQLRRIGESDASATPGPDKWSKKQILGHLIDSAANNHQRFVRLQLEPTLQLPGYAQEEWVRVQAYQDASWQDLIDLWVAYNRHLAHVVERLDPAALTNRWSRPEGDLTLEFIVKDYLRHTRHHLGQILADV